MTGQPNKGTRGLRLALAGLLAVATFILTFVTARDYGLASDVGNYFEDSLRQLRWFGDLGRSLIALDPGAALSREVVYEHWRWWPGRIPHPPLSRELSGLSYALFGWLMDPLLAYRLAVMGTYSLLVGAVALYTSRSRRSLTAGLAAGVALLTIPALFAYGHLANPDMFLAAFWFGSVATLDVHIETGRKRWLWLSALLAGAAVSTKFTGLLVGPVLLLWLMVRRSVDLSRLATLAFGTLTIFFVTNPVLWVDPVTGLSDYFSAGLGRSESALAQITTLYFGEIYSYRGPWHYPFVWTAIVVPISILVAAAVGAIADTEGRRLTMLASINLIVLYAVLLLPTAPLHDGIRLFLPGFPFVAIVTGLGADQVARWFQGTALRSWQISRHFAAVFAFLVIFSVPALRTIQYHPHQLSYFNALIGGIQGADRRGLEVTSQKEVLNLDVLSDLSRLIPAGAVVNPGFFLEEMCFYQAQGYASFGWILEGELGRTRTSEPRAWTCLAPHSALTIEILRPPRDPEFVLVLNRPGQYTLLEWSLTLHGGAPLYELRLEGVPLLQLFRVGEADAD